MSRERHLDKNEHTHYPRTTYPHAHTDEAEIPLT